MEYTRAVAFLNCFDELNNVELTSVKIKTEQSVQTVQLFFFSTDIFLMIQSNTSQLRSAHVFTYFA